MDITKVDQSAQIVRRVRAAFWLALAGISLISFICTIGDVRSSPGTDLRCRVVGARTMLLGMDPYLMPAKTDQVQTLQDPDRYAADCTRCTYTPSLLWCYAPLAKLPYQTQRYIWFGIEWCALAGSILILRAIISGPLIKEVFTAVAVFFFADGVFWRLHLERGQYYVFIGFLFCLTAWLCIGKSVDREEAIARDHWWNGIPLGIAAALRLTPLAALLPLWVAGFRRTAVGAVVVFVVCVGGTLAISGPRLWESYFRNVSIQSHLLLDSDFAAREKAALPTLPGNVEGMTFQRWIELPCANVNFTMYILQPLSQHFGWTKVRDHLQLVSRAAAVIVCLAFPVALRRRNFDAAEKIAAVFLCVLSVDFFLPTRISYADILFLLPLGLLVPAMLRQGRGYIWLGLILLALAICHGVLPTQAPISILRPLMLMTGFLGYLIVRRGERPIVLLAQQVEVEEVRARAA